MIAILVMTAKNEHGRSACGLEIDLLCYACIMRDQNTYQRINMFFLFSNPKSKKEKLNHANNAIIQGATGLTVVGIGLLVLSPVLAPEVGVGVAIILVILIAISVMSLLSCSVGALNRQEALKM